MRADLKKAWIDALRSGDYKQCSNVLHYGSGFCCLGVLLDIEGETWIAKANGYFSANNDHGLFQSETRKRLGLLFKAETGLAKMNDTGENFSVIADWIEANVTTT